MTGVRRWRVWAGVLAVAAVGSASCSAADEGKEVADSTMPVFATVAETSPSSPSSSGTEVTTTASPSLAVSTSIAVTPGTAGPSVPTSTVGAGDDVWMVIEVVDGDTIDVATETGAATVRLIGINAPEVGECFYDQATTALRFIVGSRPVRLVRDRVGCRSVRAAVAIRRAG